MNKLKSTCLIMVTLAVLLSLTISAFAAQDSYILEDGKIFRVQSSGKRIAMEEEQPGYWNTDKGTYAWILVDPELSDEMKGSKSGIYFFDEGEKSLGFLPMDGAAYSYVTFSQDGELLAIGNGTTVSQVLTIYEFNGFKKKASLRALGEFCWIDPCRLLFTVDDLTKGPRSELLERHESWLSVAIYDTVMEEMFLVKEATETQDYILIGVDHEGGTVEILENSVKSVEDWNDADKIEETPISVPIPAAG